MLRAACRRVGRRGRGRPDVQHGGYRAGGLRAALGLVSEPRGAGRDPRAGRAASQREVPRGRYWSGRVHRLPSGCSRPWQACRIIIDGDSDRAGLRGCAAPTVAGPTTAQRPLLPRVTRSRHEQWPRPISAHGAAGSRHAADRVSGSGAEQGFLARGHRGRGQNGIASLSVHLMMGPSRSAVARRASVRRPCPSGVALADA